MRGWFTLGACVLVGLGCSSDKGRPGENEGSAETGTAAVGGNSSNTVGGESTESVGTGASSSTSAGGSLTTTDAASSSTGGAGSTADPTTSAGGTGGAQTGACDVSGIAVDAGRLCVDGEVCHIRGVNWNPVPRGGSHPSDLDFAGFADQDILLMAQAGINAVRTYETITDRGVLDKLYAAGIYVLNSVYVYGGDDPSIVLERIAGIRDHAAILMWVLGNEWNYNGLYVDHSHEESMNRINEAARLLEENDGEHPVATIYGELPTRETIDQMPDIDLWGINSYRGLSFGDLFSAYQPLTDKPMFLGEYGADAYNANLPAYDPESQAQAVEALTREIVEQSLARGGEGPCVGGLVFEWADEWWKDQGGSLDVQDVGGIAPGGGPHPDQTFNEEWWGLVDIDRNPRPAYDALAGVFAEL
jgi:hypothetical protein